MRKTTTSIVNTFIRDLAYSEYAQGAVGKYAIDLRHIHSPHVPKKLLSKLRAAGEHMLLQYKYAQDPELLLKISKKEKIAKENILITEGADGASHHIAETFLSVDKQAIIAVPSFPRCEFHVKVVGAEPVFVEKLQLIQKKIQEKHYEVIFLESPGNPTGDLISREELQSFLNVAKDSIVVVDQALSGYFDDSFTKFIHQYPNLIVVKSFSKLYGIPGMRIGYLVASYKLIGYLKKTLSPFAVSSISLLTAGVVLDDTSFVNEAKRQVKKSFAYIKKNLLTPTSDSYGPFILIDGGEKIPNLYRALEEHGVLTVNGKNFRGLEKKNSVRVSLADFRAVVKFVGIINSLVIH